MKYYPVTVKLVRVFDVVRVCRGRQSPQTHFSFESNRGVHYGLSIDAYPRLQEGDQISFLLRQPDNWQTIAGWFNHQTQEYAGADVTGWLVINCIAWTITVFAMAYPSKQSAQTLPWVFLFISLVLLSKLLNVWQIRRALQVHLRGLSLP